MRSPVGSSPKRLQSTLSPPSVATVTAAWAAPAADLHDAAGEVLARRERQPIDRKDGVDHREADADDFRA